LEEVMRFSAVLLRQVLDTREARLVVVDLETGEIVVEQIVDEGVNIQCL